MKYTMTALGIALAASAAFETAANAQREGYGTRQPVQQPQPRGPQPEQPRKSSGATVTIGDRKVAISAEFAKAYQELQAAVDANDAANIPAKLAAAQAAAKSPEERLLTAQLRLNVAAKAKNEAEVAAALEAMLATGVVPQAQLPVVYTALGKARYNLKQYDQAATAFQKVQQIDPNNSEVTSLLALTRSAQGQRGDAVALLQQQIKQHAATGTKPPEPLYKRAIATAYKSKLPISVELSREWVAAYPTPTNWRDALLIYRQISNPDDAGTLDVLRLARAANALSAADYERYAYAAITKGFPGEAKAVLEEGVAAGTIDAGKSPFRDYIAEARTKSSGEAATLDGAAQRGLAAPNARQALTAGDLLYGYGQYAKAAELYRAALGKTGAEASLINLHLGMALARAGDKAGATAALNAVTGARADVAKYWIAYVATRS